VSWWQQQQLHAVDLLLLLLLSQAIQRPKCCCLTLAMLEFPLHLDLQSALYASLEAAAAAAADQSCLPSLQSPVRSDEH
jgi:hypothetical protein